jgi:hypothetical protein
VNDASQKLIDGNRSNERSSIAGGLVRAGLRGTAFSGISNRYRNSQDVDLALIQRWCAGIPTILHCSFLFGQKRTKKPPACPHARSF